MGYGGTSEDAGRALGRSGDNGVDGVIDQDPLGVDQIYIQAKRYQETNTVGAADNEPARDSTAAVLVNERFTTADVQRLVDLVRQQLPQLNAIRARKLKQLDTAPQQLAFPQ